MKKKLFVAMTILLGTFMLTFVSCNDDNDKYANEQDKTLTAQELREVLIQKTIIPSDLDTLSMSIDSIDLALKQSFMDMYLTRNCYLAYDFSDNRNLNIIVIPYRTELGKIISKKFASLHNYKFVSFNDRDYNKVSTWARVEIEKGRIVVITKKNDGSYTALSYSKTEWALLNTKF